MKKRLLGILLCLCMVLTIFPALAFAEGGEEETSVCTCETACAAGAMNADCPVCGAEGTVPESCGKYTAPVCTCETACALGAMNAECAVCGAEGTVPESCGKYTAPVCTCETACTLEAMNADCPVCGAEGAAPESCGKYTAPAEPTAVQQAQALIDALPAADTITAENRGGVEAQLTAIDEAKAALTEEERAALDFTKYDTAIAALNALDGMGGAGTPLPADDTEELQKLLSEAPDSSTVTLDRDYTITKTLEASHVTLDLKGHVIRMNGVGSVIQSSGGLTLADSDPDAAHEDSSLPAGGVITGGNATNGGGVIVGGGSFTMEGGTIFGCQADRGGGVYVKESLFTMNGGAIKGCSAHIEGGGVYAERAFIMNGGAIEDCSANYNGQAVYMKTYEFIANSGTIKGTVCVADDGSIVTNAGTSYARFYDQVTIENGSISAGIYYGGIAPGPDVISGSYHTVSFDLGGGSGSIPKQYFVGVAGPLALKPADPTKDGYTFAGWFTDKACTTPYDFTAPVTGDLTLYAGFKAANDTVALRELLANAAQNSTVKLEQDYTISETVATNANFTLDLNGHVIRMTGIGSVIQSVGVMTLMDSNPTATHEDPSLPAGGVITGGNTPGNGGGVFAPGGFTMTGGTIYNCKATQGGGVYYADQAFIMTGGAIKGCTATFGGGVFAQSGGFIMTGGAIEDCSADSNGQAVCIYRATFLADGGTVKGTVYVTDNGHIGHDAGTSFTRFYDPVMIEKGTIGYGVYYGGIAPGPSVITESYSTVSFDLGGGSGDIPTQFFVGIDTAPALKPADPTGEGYTFTGWFTDEALTTPYDFTAPVTGNLTLYAGYAYTITYDPGEYGTGSIPAGTKEHGKDFTLTTDTFTRQGYAQYAWISAENDWYPLGGTYSTDANVTLYPMWSKIETMTVPFTTTVTLGSSAAPGETVFTLELVDASGKPVSNDAVTVSGSVTTNGAGSYNGALTFAGPELQIQKLIRYTNGVFVRQVDAGAAGWTLDGRVWGVTLEEEESDITESGFAFFLRIYPVKVVDGKYVLDLNAGPVEQMLFTNVYTHTHRYTQHFNETEHWDECPCGAVRNKELHSFIQQHDESCHWDECACGAVQGLEAHSYGDWVVTRRPTGLSKGEKARSCTVCGYQQTAELPRLNPTDSPATGDNSKLALWLALLGVSAAGLSAAALYGKRRKGFRQ